MHQTPQVAGPHDKFAPFHPITHWLSAVNQNAGYRCVMLSWCFVCLGFSSVPLACLSWSCNVCSVFVVVCYLSFSNVQLGMVVTVRVYRAVEDQWSGNRARHLG
jgi:hypothetical protein